MVVAAAVGASAVAGVAGSALQANAAQSGAKAQAQAARDAAALQQAQYQQSRSDLQPFFQNAQNQIPALNQAATDTRNTLATAYGNAQGAIPQPMTIENLVKTPGYQFNLDQGLKAVQNSAAAKGLGVSGSALKGAAQYATGLADSTYQQQFANQQSIFGDYNQQFSNAYNGANAAYNQLYQPVALGVQAGIGSGQIGQAGATQAGNNIAGAGQAIAAGDIRAGQAYANGINSIGNAYGNYLGAKSYQDTQTALQGALARSNPIPG